MKKITLLLVFVLTFYGYVHGQLFSINEFSETECSQPSYKNKKTLEDCLSLVDRRYGEGETQKIIKKIGNSEKDIKSYIDVLRREGMLIKACIVESVYKQIYDYSMSFVENEKVYTLTYEPVTLHPQGLRYVYGERKLYLYQRIGHHQWVKVSDVIQVDNDQYPYVGNTELVDPSIKIIIKFLTGEIISIMTLFYLCHNRTVHTILLHIRH